MPKILTLKQLLKKKYEYLENLPDKIKESFGELVMGFVMIIWGESGNGKSNLTVQILKCFIEYGKVLYLALEEGHQRTMQRLAEENFQEEIHAGRILFGNHEMTYAETIKALQRKKSAKIIVIDSVQYWNITYEQYQDIKKLFPKKIFIFMSHTNGKNPDGKVANKIKYDADIKVYVEGYIAFPRSRFQGNKPFVIWEDGAKNYYGKDYHKKAQGIAAVKAKKEKKVKEQTPAPAEITPTEENNQ